MSHLFIQNAQIITLDPANPLIPNGQILIEDDKIAAVGDTLEAPAGATILDAENMVVTPGLINAHHHLYSSFARGYSAPGIPAENFVEILERVWWKLDLALDEDAVRYSALVAIIEAIRTGCTTIIDHHASPSCTDGSLDVMEAAFKVAGLNACLCYETSDRNRPGDGVAENIRYLKKCQKNGNKQFSALFGLHAQMTLTDSTMELCAAAAKELDCGFHIHVAEDLSDEEDCVAKYGMRIIQRLHQYGITGPKSIFVHGIHLDESEMDLIAQTGTMMIHNPESNMNNAVGAQKMLEILDKGILLGLGTDGMTSHMISSARVAHLLQRHQRRDPRVAFVESCNMLLNNNAAIAGRCFAEPRGQLVAGQLADIAIFDYAPTTPLEDGRILGHLLYGLNYARVHSTICRGRILMKNSKILSLDEQEVCAKAHEHARNTWSKIH